jgi:hypothetical protein
MPGIEPHMSATMLTMAPPRRAMHWVKHSRATRKPPVRLVLTTASQPLALMASSGVMNWPPALLTRPSMCPCSATTAATMARTASSCRMSQACVLTLPPSSAISAATA